MAVIADRYLAVGVITMFLGGIASIVASLRERRRAQKRLERPRLGNFPPPQSS